MMKPFSRRGPKRWRLGHRCGQRQLRYVGSGLMKLTVAHAVMCGRGIVVDQILWDLPRKSGDLSVI